MDWLKAQGTIYSCNSCEYSLKRSKNILKPILGLDTHDTQSYIGPVVES